MAANESEIGQRKVPSYSNRPQCSHAIHSLQSALLIAQSRKHESLMECERLLLMGDLLGLLAAAGPAVSIPEVSANRCTDRYSMKGTMMRKFRLAVIATLLIPAGSMAAQTIIVGTGN